MEIFSHKLVYYRSKILMYPCHFTDMNFAILFIIPSASFTSRIIVDVSFPNFTSFSCPYKLTFLEFLETFESCGDIISISRYICCIFTQVPCPWLVGNISVYSVTICDIIGVVFVPCFPGFHYQSSQRHAIVYIVQGSYILYCIFLSARTGIHNTVVNSFNQNYCMRNRQNLS